MNVCFMRQVQAQDDRLAAIRAAFPKEGLFAEKAWLLSPDAFPIEKKFVSELEQLGHRLFVFQRACNQIYQLSVRGKQPALIATALPRLSIVRPALVFKPIFMRAGSSWNNSEQTDFPPSH